MDSKIQVFLWLQKILIGVPIPYTRSLELSSSSQPTLPPLWETKIQKYLAFAYKLNSDCNFKGCGTVPYMSTGLLGSKECTVSQQGRQISEHILHWKLKIMRNFTFFMWSFESSSVQRNSQWSVMSKTDFFLYFSNRHILNLTR